jgi:hypothetical protein
MPRALAKRNSTTRCLTDFIGATLPLVKVDENDGEGQGKLERVLETRSKLDLPLYLFGHVLVNQHSS